MLDELVERYGEGGLVTADPKMLDSGETYRWELQINGELVPDASAQVRTDPERPDVRVMLLVFGDEEVELDRWSTKIRPELARVMRRLRELR